MNARFFVIGCSLLFFFFTACKKSDRNEDSTSTSCQDHILTEYIANDMLSMVDELARQTDGIKSTSCAYVTVDTLSIPRTITLNFDSSYCVGNGDHVRTGSIVASFNGAYLDSGSSVVITTSNYVVGKLGVNALISQTNNGNGNYWVAADYVNLEHFFDNWTSSWEFGQARTMTIGMLTPEDASDDSYSIQGSGSGQNRAGNTYTATIREPLTKTGNCDYVSSGILEIDPSNLTIRRLNYGSGCDAKATATINGDDQEITID